MGFFSYFCSRKRITDYTERYLQCILRYTKYGISHLSVGHELEYGKQHGDFVVDGRYTFEVGGAGKFFNQARKRKKYDFLEKFSPLEEH